METGSPAPERRLLNVAVLGSLTVVVLVAHRILPEQSSALAQQTIFSLHGPGFGLVALLTLELLRRSRPLKQAYIAALLFPVALAVLSELAQIPGDRSAEFSDFIVDCCGVAGVLGVRAAFDRELRHEQAIAWRPLILIAAVPALLFAVVPTFWFTFALLMRMQSLPQLASFDSSWELTYAKGAAVPLEVIPAPAGWPTGSGSIARLHSGGKWGLMLRLSPYPDWRGYRAVSFLAATPDGQPRRIAVGLWGIRPRDGSPPGRYYTAVRVKPEPSRHCIDFSNLEGLPSGRPFDLEHVAELLLGSSKNRSGEMLLVDDFRLEVDLSNCP